MANALCEDKCPLVSSLSRPSIAKKLVETAHKHGATAVAQLHAAAQASTTDAAC